MMQTLPIHSIQEATAVEGTLIITPHFRDGLHLLPLAVFTFLPMQSDLKLRAAATILLHSLVIDNLINTPSHNTAY
jgi:hypothetical protein